MKTTPASLFHPDAPNDVAPVGYNSAQALAGLSRATGGLLRHLPGRVGSMLSMTDVIRRNLELARSERSRGTNQGGRSSE